MMIQTETMHKGSPLKRLSYRDAVLVVIDLQERLLPAMRDREATETAAVKLIRGCRALGVPAVVTEQYPKGLGATVPAVLAAFEEAPASGEGEDDPGFEILSKTRFSAWGDPAFMPRPDRRGRRSIILCGVEAHVCVAQTAFDLLRAGYDIFLATDATDSRHATDKETAIRRLAAAGATESTVEAILFEMTEGADAPGFKRISAIVK